MNIDELKTMCFSNLSNDQLDNLISDLVEEQNKRKSEKKQLVWNKAVAALSDYMAEYGDIEVYNDDGDRVNLSFDELSTSTIGELYERLW